MLRIGLIVIVGMLVLLTGLPEHHLVEASSTERLHPDSDPALA
jgi:hypothetical protein